MGFREINSFVTDIVLFIIEFLVSTIVEIVMLIRSSNDQKENRKNLRNKLVLITGAGGGLGKEIAVNLSELGCRIAIVDIDENSAKTVSNEINKNGKISKSFKADISDQVEVEKLKNDVMAEMGPVDILICNAGLIPDQAADDIDNKFLKKMIDVNVYGTITVVKTFLEEMIKQDRGQIVAISSMAAISASPFCAEYSGTKAAVNVFMKALGEKLRLKKLHKKIKLTTICPFYITTRKDVIDFLNTEIRYKPLHVQEAAQRTIDAIVCRKTLVTIPSYFGVVQNVVNFLPLYVQQIFRDRIMRENEFKSPSKSTSD